MNDYEHDGFDELPDEEMEAQPMTDPDVAQDCVYERGPDGEMHEVIIEEDDGDDEDA